MQITSENLPVKDLVKRFFVFSFFPIHFQVCVGIKILPVKSTG